MLKMKVLNPEIRINPEVSHPWSILKEKKIFPVGANSFVSEKAHFHKKKKKKKIMQSGSNKT